MSEKNVFFLGVRFKDKNSKTKITEIRKDTEQFQNQNFHVEIKNKKYTKNLQALLYIT